MSDILTTKDAPASPDEIEQAQREDDEQTYHAEVRDAKLSEYAMDTVNVTRTARAMRGWLLAKLIPSAVIRTYEMGMGIQTFDTPTPAGNVVRIEAPPAVQQRALATLIALGLPTQANLASDDPDILPGVLALGPMELDAARQQAHGERYVPAERHAHAAASLASGLAEAIDDVTRSAPLRPMEERIKAGEFQVVEVVEGVGAPASSTSDQPPGPIADTETPAKAALRRLRARKNGNGATP